jgi:TIR domain-containing protein
MTSAFISHSSKDSYFVKLLVALLKFHEVQTWSSEYDIEPGTRFRTVIDDGLQSADSLIVVVSQHSAISKWVTKELAAFQEKRPEARVIPLLLDDTNPDDVIDRLTDYQALRFTDDMLSGFEKLTELYGKRFLPRIERRGKESRRNVVDRRSASERRKSEMIQRMRIGFWKAFHAKLRIGKFDKLQMGVAELFKTIEALVEEAERYGYTLPEGRQASARTVLEEATHHVWQEYRPKHQLGAVYVVEAIAEHIYATYAVSQPQQRQIQTRRDDSDRRDN